MMHRKLRRGFTLIEVLVVVLIIGVLAAIALPMYNRAVLKSRFHALMPIVKAMNDSNEAYFLEHGSYASNPQDLPVQGLSEYPTGTELEFGSNMDYAYVLATNASAKNNYIMYQKHSTNYPGEIHCEAVTGDDLAEYICVSAGGTTNLGTTLTDGYTTYVLSGSGAGIAPEASAGLDEAENGTNPYDCTKAEELGFTCTADEENGTKKICMMAGTQNVCRTKTYNEDGSYTSVTCTANAENVCKGPRYFTTYDANGNKLTERTCSSVDSSGNCTAYSPYDSNKDYTYDANGNMLSQRNCRSFDSNGNCTAYHSGGAFDYTYDANGNRLSQRNCSSVDNSGNCTEYSYGYNYTYDTNGNMLTSRQCNGVDSSGNCTSYSTTYNYTYDENGNRLTQRWCSSVDSSGKCTASSTSDAYDYTYDVNGNMLKELRCSRVDNKGNCTAYQADGSYNYTYDANGNKLTERACSRVDSSGNCTAYQANYSYDYTYDANGNQLTERRCSSVDSSGNCTAYTAAGSYDYTYDDNGKLIVQQECSSAFNTATGECITYNNTSLQPY